MKKRIVALVLAVLTLVLALGFAGCKKNDKTDWDYIADKGELVIGITYFRPMNYMENGELVGFETEFAKAVCEKLGVTAKFQEIDWDSKVTELNSKTIDCIWNGMTATDELKNQINFSSAYMNNSQVAVIRKADAAKYKDLASMSGAKVVAEAGSAGEIAVKADAGLSKSYLPVKDQGTSLMEVKSKTADIAIIDAVTAAGSIGEGTDYDDLMIVDVISMRQILKSMRLVSARATPSSPRRSTPLSRSSTMTVLLQSLPKSITSPAESSLSKATN